MPLQEDVRLYRHDTHSDPPLKKMRLSFWVVFLKTAKIGFGYVLALLDFKCMKSVFSIQYKIDFSTRGSSPKIYFIAQVIIIINSLSGLKKEGFKSSSIGFFIGIKWSHRTQGFINTYIKKVELLVSNDSSFSPFCK